MKRLNEKLEATARLLEVMETLREQCPWDRKQTFDTLRNNTIEETYELVDAISDHNLEGIKEELGDLLLHVVFYAKLGDEEGAFDYADVANALCDKLIYRHPHIYGDIHADTPEEVKANWEIEVKADMNKLFAPITFESVNEQLRKTEAVRLKKILEEREKKRIEELKRQQQGEGGGLGGFTSSMGSMKSAVSSMGGMR